MIFRDKYFFLSNFYPCQLPLKIGDKVLVYQSVEAAYQAHKNIDLADKFVNLKPLEAKKYGKHIPLTTENWSIYRLYVMAKLLNLKFKDVELFIKLKEVKEEIVEDNYWYDEFWGVCKGKGLNMLGRLLMCIRDNNNDLNILYNLIETELVYEI